MEAKVTLVHADDDGSANLVSCMSESDKRWTPDSASDRCQLCRASFSLHLRRHHCRICGALLCDGCTSKRIRVGTEDSSVRACNACFQAVGSYREFVSKYGLSLTHNFTFYEGFVPLSLYPDPPDEPYSVELWLSSNHCFLCCKDEKDTIAAYPVWTLVDVVEGIKTDGFSKRTKVSRCCFTAPNDQFLAKESCLFSLLFSDHRVLNLEANTSQYRQKMITMLRALTSAVHFASEYNNMHHLSLVQAVQIERDRYENVVASLNRAKNDQSVRRVAREQRLAQAEQIRRKYQQSSTQGKLDQTPLLRT